MKLKENISFKDLEKYGFIEDPSNCEPGETYRLTSRLGCQYGVILNKDGYIVVPGKSIKSVKEN